MVFSFIVHFLKEKIGARQREQTQSLMMGLRPIELSVVEELRQSYRRMSERRQKAPAMDGRVGVQGSDERQHPRYGYE